MSSTNQLALLCHDSTTGASQSSTSCGSNLFFSCWAATTLTELPGSLSAPRALPGTCLLRRRVRCRAVELDEEATVCTEIRLCKNDGALEVWRRGGGLTAWQGTWQFLVHLHDFSPIPGSNCKQAWLQADTSCARNQTLLSHCGRDAAEATQDKHECSCIGV